MEFIQGANTLFRFVNQKEFLYEVLKERAFIPRYSDEDISYLEFENKKMISIPMVCFCDIRIAKLDEHFSFYGNSNGFGIGMTKEWGINKGIQPLQYININSSLSKETKLCFEKAINEAQDIEVGKVKNDNTKEYRDYLLKQLFYMKPLTGDMTRRDKNGELKIITKNFHDEQEWRYIPDDPNIKVFLDDNKKVSIFNEVLRDKDIKGSLWLDFEYEDIKYLIVPNKEEQMNFINFICDKLELNELEKILIASKIIVYDEIRSDV